jgi:hypothetical protein
LPERALVAGVIGPEPELLGFVGSRHVVAVAEERAGADYEGVVAVVCCFEPWRAISSSASFDPA